MSVKNTGVMLPYGKYQGREISNIPHDYLAWFLAHARASAEIKDAINDHLHPQQKAALAGVLGQVDNQKVNASVEALTVQSELASLGIVQVILQKRRERQMKKPAIIITRTKISEQSAASPHRPLLAAGQDGLPRFTRGKHEGKSVQEVSTAYLTSLLRLGQLCLSDDEIVSTEYWTRRMGKPCTFAEAREIILAEIEQVRAERESV